VSGEVRAGRKDLYRLTGGGREALAEWGVARSALRTDRPLRYCVDWTEQAHHLAGPLGTAVTDRLFELGYLVRGTVPRSVRLTPLGREGLAWLGS